LLQQPGTVSLLGDKTTKAKETPERS